MKKWMIRVVTVVSVTAVICICLIVFLAVEKAGAGEFLKLPTASEVTACYYVPDLDKPYEQTWYGGEELEDILAELATQKFTEADEAPPEGAFRAALVVATNQEQIMVLWDREYRAWVYDEERGWRHETKAN